MKWSGSKCFGSQIKSQKDFNSWEWLSTRNRMEFEGYLYSPELKLEKSHIFKLHVGDTCLNCSSGWDGGCAWRFYLTEEDHRDLSAKEWCALRCVNSDTLSRLRGEAPCPLAKVRALVACGPNALCCVRLTLILKNLEWNPFGWGTYSPGFGIDVPALILKAFVFVDGPSSPLPYRNTLQGPGISPKPTLREALNEMRGIKKKRIQIVKELDSSSHHNSWENHSSVTWRAVFKYLSIVMWKRS